jgi:FkbM family methyltransferase
MTTFSFVNKNSYARDAEDLWLLEQFPADFKGYAVELGALDGVNLSCTLLLEEKGWDVLCIEPNPRHQKALRDNRKRVLTCACDYQPRITAPMWENHRVPDRTQTSLNLDHAAWEVEFGSTVLTLDQCLMISGFPRLDALVLDVDGYERRVLMGFDIDRWNPKAVIIEGESGGRLKPFLSRGYVEVGRRMDDNRLLLRQENP